MVTISANLYAGCDNSGLNQPFSIKIAIASPYSKDFEKIMYAEFQSHIKNDNSKY